MDRVSTPLQELEAFGRGRRVRGAGRYHLVSIPLQRLEAFGLWALGLTSARR